MSMSNTAEKVCGIYRITNTINGKCYIGQSIDIHKRFIHHTSESRHQRQHMAISKAIQKYWKDAFCFEILVKCTIDELNDKERYFVEKYNSVAPNGYNMRSGGDIRGCYVSEEAKRNMSKARTGMKLSPSAVENIRKASIGRKQPRESVERTRLANIGRIVSNETRLKMSISAKNKPKATEQTRLKLSLANKGKKRFDNAKKVIREDGVVFDSGAEASRALGFKDGRIVSNAIGAGRRAGGFYFKYILEV